MDRRAFLRLTSMGAVGLFVTNGQHTTQIWAAPIPGGALAPQDISKWQTPLLIPPQMPRAGLLLDRGSLVDYYEIAVRQFSQQILPAGMPATTVWGYGPSRALSASAPRIFNAPSLTIEANAGRPVRIKWIDELKDAAGHYLPHLLPVDPTLHWANPAGGIDGRDTRPSFDETPGPYRGPVPMVSHVHGAIGVADDSDGYAEAWYLPEQWHSERDMRTWGLGTILPGKAAKAYGVSWRAGSATFQYPNNDRAGTKWYHDHTVGMTRVNVYAGPAGFYLIRGGQRATRRFVIAAPADRHPSRPAPQKATRSAEPPTTRFPSPSKTAPSIPTARSSTRTLAPSSTESTGPFAPSTDVPPIWNPEFFGNTIMVNGHTGPTSMSSSGATGSGSSTAAKPDS